MADSAVRPLVRVDGLKVYFPIQRGRILPRTVGYIRAVDGVSFEITRGEALGLVGESGCGKSSVGRALLRIEPTHGGTITFDGDDITHISGAALRSLTRRIQMIFQDSYASVDPRMRIGQIIEEPLVIHRTADRAGRARRIAELLDLVGLPDRYTAQYAHQLSGGQRQRVGIARALALEPDFIVCDEAVSALDVSIQAQIVNLLQDLQERLNLTYLFIAHDIAIVRHVCERIVVMYLGRVMEVGNSEAIVANPLHPYTRALMASVAIPDPERDAARRRSHTPLTGELPSPSATHLGCRFASRCPEAVTVKSRLGLDCAQAEPPLREVARGRHVACHLHSD